MFSFGLGLDSVKHWIRSHQHSLVKSSDYLLNGLLSLVQVYSQLVVLLFELGFEGEQLDFQFPQVLGLYTRLLLILLLLLLLLGVRGKESTRRLNLEFIETLTEFLDLSVDLGEAVVHLQTEGVLLVALPSNLSLYFLSELIELLTELLP